MGTRHLIAVQLGGEYKVAQYGQWDGYPSGAGTDVLSFLRTVDLATFTEGVRATSFYTDAELQSLDDAKVKIADYPELSRDTSADILNMVMIRPGLKLKSSLDFAGDSLFCEWAYVIDLDSQTFEVFKGFNKAPVPSNARFNGESVRTVSGDTYYPVRLVGSWPLSSLPDDATLLAGDAPEEEVEDDADSESNEPSPVEPPAPSSFFHFGPARLEIRHTTDHGHVSDFYKRDSICSVEVRGSDFFLRTSVITVTRAFDTPEQATEAAGRVSKWMREAP